MHNRDCSKLKPLAWNRATHGNASANTAQSHHSTPNLRHAQSVTRPSSAIVSKNVSVVPPNQPRLNLRTIIPCIRHCFLDPKYHVVNPVATRPSNECIIFSFIYAVVSVRVLVPIVCRCSSTNCRPVLYSPRLYWTHHVTPTLDHHVYIPPSPFPNRINFKRSN